MVEELLNMFNYKILDLDYNNLVLIPGNQEKNINDVYNDGYLHREDRKIKFHYNHDFEEIYSLPKDEQIDFINQKFIKYKDKYVIS
jgi:hypothetical protein